MSVTIFNAPAENRAAALHNMISTISTLGNIYQQGKELGLKKEELSSLKDYHDQSIQAQALQAGYVQDPNGNVTLGGKKYAYQETPAQQQQKFQNVASGAKGLYDTLNPFQKYLGLGVPKDVVNLRNQAAALGNQVVGSFPGSSAAPLGNGLFKLGNQIMFGVPSAMAATIPQNTMSPTVTGNQSSFKIVKVH